MPEIPAARQQSHISDDEILVSLQRVLGSKVFSHSTTLRQALEFVVRNNIDSPGEPIKEYSVATKVFGRKSDFDPKIDNIVRVQMHRLREKLEEFYSTEGQGEQVRILIPRGQYNPEYCRASKDTQPATPHLPQSPGVTGERKSGRLNVFWIVIVVLAISNGFLLVNLLKNKGSRQPADLTQSQRSLWQPFLSPDSRPLIVFANPAFLVGKRGDLYRYSSQDVLSMAMGTRVPMLNRQDISLPGMPEVGPFYYFDSYTGTGELVAATDVACFLSLHGESFVIERSRLVSDAEISRSNVIFLGGNKEDRLFRRLPFKQDLIFEPPPANKYAVGSYIQDLNPSSGHPSTYHLQLDPATGAIHGDYALISLLPNVSVDHYVLDLGGLTTLGTQAAAKFVTSRHDMAVLEHMLAAASGQKTHSPFFQALLEVSVRDGVPLEAKCVLVRELK